ncbi:hypothetical protein NC651_033038 [Populus alba x Populus x berolinensis]|nr:hypothetical protein NC651_033033 [Populus alba x Populus x berolinensis]KAJ6867881.1 hypothetical protein NC651_033038 [Populus alba x Populus x berolinensis]
MGAGGEVMVEPHGHEGAFIAKGEEDALVTKKMVPASILGGVDGVWIESFIHEIAPQSFP